MNLELCKEFTFEASHILPKHPGKCSRLHGHSWKLRVYVKGEVNKETGFVMDYADIKRIVAPIVDALDHKHLGEWSGDTEKTIGGPSPAWEIILPDTNYVVNLPFDFYPSSENLIEWIGWRLLGNFPPIDSRERQGQVVSTGSLNWSKLELDETCTSSCILTREEYDKQAGRR